MKAVLYVKANHNRDPERERRNLNVLAMAEGIKRHGHQCIILDWDNVAHGDLIVVWGWRNQKAIRLATERHTPILVMERGHIPPRLEWISCGWNGLGGRGLYPRAMDGGKRWDQNFSHFLQEWKTDGDYALVLGQLQGDMATIQYDHDKWTSETIAGLTEIGESVRYRPHPLTRKRLPLWHLSRYIYRSLEKDFKGARRAIAINSTATVESVLAGIPTTTLDPGAMAWPVTTHDLKVDLIRPDRISWCHDLAWTQWRRDEIARGEAWEVLQTCMTAPLETK